MANKKKIEEMDERELIYTLLSSKIGSVDPKDVFFAKRMDSGPNSGKFSVLLGGKKLTPNQLSNLQQEAMMLDKMQLWTIFTQTLSHEANLRMFKEAKTERDLDWGKAILHAVSIFESIVYAIQNAHMETVPTAVVHRKN